MCDEWCYISIVPESLGSIKSVWYFDKFSSCKTDFVVHAVMSHENFKEYNTVNRKYHKVHTPLFILKTFM